MVFTVGILEWEFALNHYKKNHTQRKYVNFKPTVRFFLVDFRSCVDFCAPPAGEFVDLGVGRHSKISYLQIIILVHENILRF